MSARVASTGGEGVNRRAGGVVDRIHPERSSANLRAQRIHEYLSSEANTRWLKGAGANTTSMSGHGSASAEGMPIAVFSIAHVVHTAAQSVQAIRRAPISLMLTYC